MPNRVPPLDRALERLKGMTALTDKRSRQPHALLDKASRLKKAEKIQRIVGAERLSKASRILEAGTGSGHIAHYFAAQYPRTSVVAADVVDSRVVTEGYDFAQLSGTALPFEPGSFDVVISNHVLEHVGDWTAQLDHLTELRRVLAPDGVMYLAIPNRWSPYEGHFRLPFLSWPPRSVRDAYVRVTGRGSHYDCEPRGAIELRRLFSSAGLDYKDMTMKALETMLSVEHRGAAAPRLLTHIALVAGHALFPIMPTYVFLLSKNQLP